MKFFLKKNLVLSVVGVSMFSIFGCSNDSAEMTEFKNSKVLNQATISRDIHFANQDEIIKSLEIELGKKHSIAEPFVVVDPFNISPLTALAIFVTDEPVKITLIVRGDDEYSTIKHSFNVMGKNHMVPIYGLYPNRNNNVEIVAENKNGVVKSTLIEIKTDALPSDISKVRVEVNRKEKVAKGLTFVDCPHVNGNYMLAIDVNGAIRWYLSEKKYNGSVMLTHLKNGNMLISNGEPIPNTYNNLPTVYEMSPLGRVYAAYNVYGIHHDIRETKNGNLIMAVSDKNRQSQNDFIVEVERTSGKVVKTWDLKEILPMREYKAEKPYGGGYSNWLHNNAIWYDEDKGEFVVSGRHQNVVAKFDANTNKLKWVLSKTIGENNEEIRPFLLKSSGEFEFPTAQHAAMQLPDGKIMLLDNTNFDIVDDERNLLQERMYTRAVIYEVDEKDMEVKQVWEYGKSRGRNLYSSFVSDVDYLGKNHYLIDFGGKYIADNGDVFDHMYTPKKIKNQSNRQSTIIEILNDEVIWEVDLYGNSNSNTYKAERKDIYQGH